MHLFSCLFGIFTAIVDKDAWMELKLPSRLKIELKRLVKIEMDELKRLVEWEKCYSESDNCYYFYNNKSKSTEWSIPPGTKYVDIDGVISFVINSKSDDDVLEELKESMNSSTSRDVLDCNIMSSKTSSAPPSYDINSSPLFRGVTSPLPLVSYPPLPPEFNRSPTSSLNEIKSENTVNQNNVFPDFTISDVDSESETEGCKSSTSFVVDEPTLRRLVEMGFDESMCIVALTESNNKLPEAALLLLSQSNQSSKAEPVSNFRSESFDSHETMPTAIAEIITDSNDEIDNDAVVRSRRFKLISRKPRVLSFKK